MIKTEVIGVVGTFVVNLSGLKTKNHLFYKKLHLNKNENNFDEKLNHHNYNITGMKLHDFCLESIFRYF